jgi:hypothetical protein
VCRFPAVSYRPAARPPSFAEYFGFSPVIFCGQDVLAVSGSTKPSGDAVVVRGVRDGWYLLFANPTPGGGGVGPAGPQIRHELSLSVKLRFNKAGVLYGLFSEPIVFPWIDTIVPQRGLSLIACQARCPRCTRQTDRVLLLRRGSPTMRAQSLFLSTTDRAFIPLETGVRSHERR